MFVLLLLAGAVTVAAYAYLRYGRVDNWSHWAWAGGVLLLLLLILSTVNNARAQEVDFLAYTELYAGVENSFIWPTSPHCEKGGDTLIVNTGVNQNLIQVTAGNTETSVNAGYRHNSCVVGDDRELVDNFGITASWRVYW